ncbi:MAG: hypothetical protein ACLFUS_16450 [Candidatus Sumerlaeia bacterium]
MKRRVMKPTFSSLAILMLLLMSLWIGAAIGADHGAAEEKAEEEAVKHQEKCPVMGGKVNKDLYVDKDGKRIYVCCKGCLDKVEKNFDTYAKEYKEKGIDISKPKEQSMCPVMNKKINKSLYVDNDGKRIYVCCRSCLGKVKADFDKYAEKLEEKGVDLSKPEEKKEKE